MDNISWLEQRWFALMARLNPTANKIEVSRWWECLQEAYTQTHRHHHTFEHIAFGLAQLDRVRDRLSCADMVEYAWWFHDMVYLPQAQDTNETLSADKAEKCAEELKLSVKKEMVRHLILATSHHHPTQTEDEKMMMDIDLSILGAPWPIYWTYAKRIKKEYVPYFGAWKYRVGRLRFLSHMRKQRIFQTDFFRAIESSARKNIRKEMCFLAILL
jgi:predicted metal-dependent HD superfamily phosphohydrolase